MSAFVITVGGEDITERVIFADATFETRAGGSAPGKFKFRVKDLTHSDSFTVGAEVVLWIDEVRMFGGYLQKVGRQFFFAVDNTGNSRMVPRNLVLEGVDYGILFQKRILFDHSDPTNGSLRKYPEAVDDTVVIYDMTHEFLDLGGDGLDVTSKVRHVGTPNPDGAGYIIGAGLQWGQEMGVVARLVGAIFYITPKKELVYTDVDTEDAPVGLSDTPYYLPSEARLVWQDIPVAEWQPNTFYSWATISSGWVRRPGTLDVYYLNAENGYSGSSEPDWDTGVNYSIPDNEIQWDGLANSPTEVLPWENDWAPSGEHYEDETVTPSVHNGHVYYLSNGNGISGEIEPSWPIDGGTVVETVTPISIGDEDTIGYRDMEILYDGANLINEMFVWGWGQGSNRVVLGHSKDQDSINEHGLWQAGESRPDIWRQASVNKRAESFVYGNEQSLRGHKDDAVSAMCAVFEPVFEVAQKVEFISNTFNFWDIIPIRVMVITFPTTKDAKFNLTLSHHLDEPWNTFEYWFPPFPLPPGIVPRPEEQYGWTVVDSFDVRVLCHSPFEGLGTADSPRDETRIWVGEGGT